MKTLFVPLVSEPSHVPVVVKLNTNQENSRPMAWYATPVRRTLGIKSLAKVVASCPVALVKTFALVIPCAYALNVLGQTTAPAKLVIGIDC